MTTPSAAELEAALSAYTDEANKHSYVDGAFFQCTCGYNCKGPSGASDMAEHRHRAAIAAILSSEPARIQEAVEKERAPLVMLLIELRDRECRGCAAGQALSTRLSDGVPFHRDLRGCTYMHSELAERICAAIRSRPTPAASPTLSRHNPNCRAWSTGLLVCDCGFDAASPTEGEKT